jgi:hypothetical protein
MSSYITNREYFYDFSVPGHKAEGIIQKLLSLLFVHALSMQRIIWEVGS